MSLELDEKIERRLLQKGLNDVVQNLQKVSVGLQKDSQTDEKIFAAIQENSRVFNVFLDKFKEYLEHENTPEEPPKINVNTQQEKVVAAITEQNKLLELISNNQKSIIELVGKKPTRLNVTRNDYGTIKYVEIQY